MYYCQNNSSNWYGKEREKSGRLPEIVTKTRGVRKQNMGDLNKILSILLL